MKISRVLALFFLLLWGATDYLGADLSPRIVVRRDGADRHRVPRLVDLCLADANQTKLRVV